MLEIHVPEMRKEEFSVGCSKKYTQLRGICTPVVFEDSRGRDMGQESVLVESTAWEEGQEVDHPFEGWEHVIYVVPMIHKSL